MSTRHLLSSLSLLLSQAQALFARQEALHTARFAMPHELIPSMLNNASSRFNGQSLRSVADRYPSGHEPVEEHGSPHSLLNQSEQLPGHTPYRG